MGARVDIYLYRNCDSHLTERRLSPAERGRTAPTAMPAQTAPLSNHLKTLELPLEPITTDDCRAAPAERPASEGGKGSEPEGRSRIAIPTAGPLDASDRSGRHSRRSIPHTGHAVANPALDPASCPDRHYNRIIGGQRTEQRSPVGEQNRLPRDHYPVLCRYGREPENLVARRRQIVDAATVRPSPRHGHGRCHVIARCPQHTIGRATAPFAARLPGVMVTA